MYVLSTCNTNGFNIHDFKSQMQHLNPHTHLSFLKDITQIIPRGEDIAIIEKKL